LNATEQKGNKSLDMSISQSVFEGKYHKAFQMRKKFDESSL